MSKRNREYRSKKLLYEGMTTKLVNGILINAGDLIEFYGHRSRIYVAIPVARQEMRNECGDPGLHFYGAMWQGHNPRDWESFAAVAYLDGPGFKVIGNIDDYRGWQREQELFDLLQV